MNEAIVRKQITPFRKLKICVKIVAVITVLLGSYSIPKLLMPAFEKPLNDYLVTGKFATMGWPCLQVKPQVANADIQTIGVSSSMFDAAWIGDHLQMQEWGGYMRLVRANRVVHRSYSADQKQLFLFIFCAMFPMLVFVPFKNRQLIRLVLTVSILCELVVIGMVLFACLLVLGLGHNC